MLFLINGGKDMESDKQNLQRTMTSRHITMMALGGAIGAGLFKGVAQPLIWQDHQYY